MRALILAAVAASTLAAAAPAHGRLFWQTYGATVASPAGCGCAWNLGSDYFVPRTCDAGQYDLFSACKSHHSISPACKNLHPVYAGYCTPYGECHYKWRDHVYKKHCGCTPLGCFYGDWHLDKCAKHGCGGAETTPCGGPGACHPAAGGACHTEWGASGFAEMNEELISYLPNVEPLGGETLGTVEAFPAGLLGAAGAGASAMPNSAAMPVPAPAAPMGTLPAPSGGLTVPGLFGN